MIVKSIPTSNSYETKESLFGKFNEKLNQLKMMEFNNESTVTPQIVKMTTHVDQTLNEIQIVFTEIIDELVASKFSLFEREQQLFQLKQSRPSTGNMQKMTSNTHVTEAAHRPLSRKHSSKRHTVSPRRLVESPHKHVETSQKHATSPHRRLASPQKHVEASQRHATSPHRQTQKNKEPSQMYADASQRHTVSPHRQSQKNKEHSQMHSESSQRHATSPQRRLTSPHKHAESVQRYVASPQKHVETSQRHATSPHRQTQKNKEPSQMYAESSQRHADSLQKHPEPSTRNGELSPKFTEASNKYHEPESHRNAEGSPKHAESVRRNQEHKEASQRHESTQSYVETFQDQHTESAHDNFDSTQIHSEHTQRHLHNAEQTHRFAEPSKRYVEASHQDSELSNRRVGSPYKYGLSSHRNISTISRSKSRPKSGAQMHHEDAIDENDSEKMSRIQYLEQELEEKRRLIEELKHSYVQTKKTSAESTQYDIFDQQPEAEKKPKEISDLYLLSQKQYPVADELTFLRENYKDLERQYLLETKSYQKQIGYFILSFMGTWENYLLMLGCFFFKGVLMLK